MNNYPPGVTGNEPELRGYDEYPMSVECGKPASIRIYSEASRSRMRQIVGAAKSIQRMVAEEGSSASTARQVNYLLNLLDNFERTTEDWDTDECPFMGEVDVYSTSRYTAEWTCPYCGMEHEHDSSPDPD